MADVVQESIIDHMVATQENMLASFDIHQNFKESMATRICAWSQKLHENLIKEEPRLASWRNKNSRPSDISWILSWSNPLSFSPANVKHFGVAIEFQARGGLNAILGVWVDEKTGEKDNLREYMTKFFKEPFPNRYMLSSSWWPCYDRLQPPYKNWLEKDLIVPLYDNANIMLYDQIRELCLACQDFLDKDSHKHFVKLLQE